MNILEGMLSTQSFHREASEQLSKCVMFKQGFANGKGSSSLKIFPEGKIQLNTHGIVDWILDQKSLSVIYYKGHSGALDEI